MEDTPGIKSEMAVTVRTHNGPLYMDVDGDRLTSCYSVDLYRSALRYEPQPDDKFVVTYKKSGTTWAQQIGYLFFHSGIPPPTALEFMKSSPFLEMFGVDAVRDMDRPGLIKTHLPYWLVPLSSKAKYLYVCRNPKDVCVSLFYFTRGNSVYDFKAGTFEDFFEVFFNGRTDHGDYFDHVLSWYAHRDDPNVLLVHYEDMKEDPRTLTLRIAEFLDEDVYNILMKNEEIFKKVLNNSTISFMKAHLEKTYESFFSNPLVDKSVPPGLKFFHERMLHFSWQTTYTRKGVVGDWQLHFTPKMNARMEEKIFQKLSHTGLIDIWRKHGVMTT